MGFLALPVDDCVSEGLELVPVRLAVQVRPGLPSVVERDFTRPLERAARGDPHERPVERAAGERAAYDLVVLRREQERQRRRPLAEIGARDLPRLDRQAGAVEDVVGDLECDAERQAERARAAAEPAATSNSAPVFSAQRSR